MGERGFQVVPWYHYLWVFFGMELLAVVAFFPDATPYDSLGAVGSFLKYLAYNYPLVLKLGFVASELIHLGEALYVRTLCRKYKLSGGETMNWMIQTFYVGFTSILLLKATYQKKPK